MSNNNHNVQSIIFDKKYFTLKESENWLKYHGHKNFKVDKTQNFYRFRQLSPLMFDNFFTRNVERGVKMIIGY